MKSRQGFVKGKNNPGYRHGLGRSDSKTKTCQCGIMIQRRSKSCKSCWQKGLTKGHTVGERNYAWKGNSVGYSALHSWVLRHKIKPPKCAFCESDFSLEWANKSHEYKRDLDDWICLCAKCHDLYDKSYWGQARRRFTR